MKGQFKKITTLVLCLVMVLGIIPVNNGLSFADTGSKTSYDFTLGNVPGISFQALKEVYRLPPEIPESIKVGRATLHFNKELYLDQYIFVYGDYSTVKGVKNDWSPKTKGGTKYYNNGEYRYHGYTVDGNYYSNKNFPDDVKESDNLSGEEWLYHWWDEKGQRMSRWNVLALNDKNPAQAKMQESINNLIKFPITVSTNSSAAYDPNGGYMKYDHLNVMTYSTTLFNGEGRMYHKKNNKFYYQTFSTEKILKKDPTPYTLDIEIKDKDKIVALGKDYVTVNVAFTGTLKDAQYYNDQTLRPLYYNRDDVKDCYIKFDTGKQTKEADPKTIVVSQDSQGNRTYNGTIALLVKASDISNLTVTGTSHLNYETGMASETAKDTDSLGAVSSPQGINLLASIQSDHNVDNVNLSPEDMTSGTNPINYTDSSLGKIAKWDFTIVVDGKPLKTEGTGSPNKGAIDSFIWNKIKLKVGNKETLSFETKQTIYDDNGKNSESEATFSVSMAMPVIVDIDFEIPDKNFDILPFDARNYTDMSTVQSGSEHVFLNGKEVDFDDFFSGNYVFGPSDVNYPVNVVVKMTSSDGTVCKANKWTVIYTTKPRVQLTFQGSTKVNRKITVINQSEDPEYSLNDPYLLSHYANHYTFEYKSEDGNECLVKDGGDFVKYLMHRKTGMYEVKLIASNDLGRVSDSYILKYYVLEDLAPNTIFNIWNNVLTRGEKVSYILDIQSLDGDSVSYQTAKILYDADDDGVFETTVADLKSKNDIDAYSWVFDQLGHYRVVSYAKEKIDSNDTIPEFLLGNEERDVTTVRDFYIDNLRPVTQIDIDLPPNITSVDLLLLGNKDISRETNKTLRENIVNYSNSIRLGGVDAIASYWDTYTYVSSAPANKQLNTGGSYPSATYYYNENGYEGSIPRTRLVNNSGTKHWTTYTYKEECHDGEEICGWTGGHSEPNPDYEYGCHCAQYITVWHDYECHSKEVCERVSIPHEHSKDYDNYTGYYEGTVYKRVKQDYPDKFRADADRFVLLYSESDDVDLTDYKYVQNHASFKTIFIGKESQKDKMGLTENDYFVSLDENTLDEAMTKAIGWMKSQYENSSDYIMLKGTPFNLTDIIYDTENDAIDDYGYQYVQEDVFDNSLGLEDFANTELVKDPKAFTDYKATTFNKVGKFRIYKLLKDSTGKVDFDKESNLANISIIVHRKPIADFDLDWTYDTTNNNYKTTWTDKSYDLDHQFSDPEKGIRDREIKYRKTNGGDGKWVYKIPDQLQSGTYEVQYMVKDIEGAWSDLVSKTYTLTDVPPVQILDGKVKPTLDQKFTIDAIPASEDLTFYDAETRYPTTPHLEYGIYDSTGNLKTPMTSQYLSDGEIVSGQDIYWTASNYKIPETLPDGVYDARLYAVDENIPLSRNYKAFPIVVKTPINLEVLKLDKLVRDYYRDTQAQTSKYASQANVTFFYGTSFQKTVNMTLDGQNGDLKTWSLAYKETRNIPEGTYTARYTAMTPNGNVETKDKSFEFIINAPPTVTFESYIPKGKLYVGHHLVYTVLPKDENDPQVTLDYYVKKPGENYTKVGTYTQVKVGEPFTLDPVVIDQAGDYGFKIIATDPPGDTGQAESVLETNARGIGDFKIEGAWNHWRGQIDLYGNRMIVMPHRFLSYEKVYFTVTTDAIPDAVSIRFSPELEAMTYTDKLGNVYDYKDDIYETVNFPLELDCVKKDTDHDTSIWKGEYILPLADSTMGFDDVRLGDAYNVEATAHYINDPSSVNPTYDDQKKIEDIDITGNIYDMIEIQPTYHE